MALRVLLADNSETIKKVIQLTLQDFEIDLRVVTLGVDVLDVALQFKPDIIFVDILLQKKSGYDVSKELKNNVNLKNTPVVLMWSGFMEFDEPKAKESLADARLEKPFDAETLKNLVNKLVKKPTPANVSDFLDFPTTSGATVTKTLPSAPKSKHEDPLKNLGKIQAEAEKFKPIELPDLMNDLDAQDYTANNSAKEEPSTDDFEMHPLDKTTGFGYRSTQPPDVDHPSLSQTKSFVLSLPDDMNDGEDVPVDFDKIDSVEDMSFLLNPESVVKPPAPAQAPAAKAAATEPAKVAAAPAKAAPMPEHVAPVAPPMPKMPSAQDIERIVREEIREAIEKAVWQVVPELASQLIKKELDRLLKDDSNT